MVLCSFHDLSDFFLLECKNRLFLELSYGVWDQTLSWKWSYLVSLLSKDLIFFALSISSLLRSHQLLENVCLFVRETLWWKDLGFAVFHSMGGG